jgi:hypothetical protein
MVIRRALPHGLFPRCFFPSHCARKRQAGAGHDGQRNPDNVALFLDTERIRLALSQVVNWRCSCSNPDKCPPVYPGATASIALDQAKRQRQISLSCIDTVARVDGTPM